MLPHPTHPVLASHHAAPIQRRCISCILVILSCQAARVIRRMNQSGCHLPKPRFWTNGIPADTISPREISRIACFRVPRRRRPLPRCDLRSRYARRRVDAPEIEDRGVAEVADLARRDRKVPRGGRLWRWLEGCFVVLRGLVARRDERRVLKGVSFAHGSSDFALRKRPSLVGGYDLLSHFGFGERSHQRRVSLLSLRLQ